MKKTLLTISAALAVGLLATLVFFFDLDQRVIDLFTSSTSNNRGTLTITSRNGSANITLNSEDLGSTPLNDFEIDSGEHDITITRESASEGFYNPFQVPITVAPSTQSVIDIEIGPSSYKHGFVLYYLDDTSKSDNTGTLYIDPTPFDARITVDSEIHTEQLIQLNEGEYQVKFEREGYEDLTVPVVINPGLNLNLRTYQMPIPTDINSAQSDDAD